MQGATHDRLGWASLAIASCVVLLVARALTPAASGLGTHTQLGLPPCGFLALFQLPCPACGLTTAFVHLAHGSLRASLAAHPLGLPLFLGLSLAVPRALYESVRARSLAAWLLSAQLTRLAWLYTAALLVVWIVRLSR